MFKYFALLLILSGCAQNQTYNRGYVISQTQMESDEDPSIEQQSE